MENYEKAVNNIANQYESGILSEIQTQKELKKICNNRANIIKSDSNISIADRENLADVFYVIENITDDISLVLQEPTFENGLIKTKWGRALIRILLVAAATVTVVYTAGLAVSVLKMKGIYIGSKAASTAVLTKSTVAGGKMYGALTYGIGKGMIGAVQKMDVEWKGIKNEALYATVKVVW